MEREKGISSPARKPLWPLAFLGILGLAWLRSLVKPPGQLPNPSTSPTSSPAKEGNRRTDHSEITTQTPQNAETTCKCCHHKTPRWKAFVDGAALLVGALTLIVLCIYARDTHNIWVESKRSSDAAKKSADTAYYTLIASARPWVGLSTTPIIQLTQVKPKNIQGSITLTMRNFGKGPAFKAMVDAQFSDWSHRDNTLQSTCNLMFPFIGVKPTSPVATSDESSYKKHWGSLIFPDRESSTTAYYADRTSDLIGKEAYIVGCIVYADQFGAPHWTKFCYNTGDFAKDVVRDASAFTHLYMCNTDNYTDEAESTR